MSKPELIVALGERRYAVERPWPQTPEGRALKGITDVAVDSRGQVLVYQRIDSLVEATIDAVAVFDAAGQWVGSWGRDEVVDAHSLSVAPDGRILLIDRDAHQVLIFDADFRPLGSLGERHGPNRPFNHPTDVAVAPSGDIYVADGYGAAHVHRFDAAGRLLQTWGRPGRGPGEFTTPHGIAVLPDGRVLVGDRENDRVQVFTPEGAFLDAWGDFFHPMDIHVDATGLVHVTDQIPRLSLLAPDGTLLGRCRPVLNGAHGMSSDKAGNLYLAEQNPNRVTRLRRLG
ncbi:peptidase [Prosthecomicrobium hirschii]|uniref:Peptidase n=1 Tax=Prosthecodimorpha hirschii TaxID=665126 RepID=A0A0P6WAW5_9HYPH|nr:peptidyl-alpha-hydroxyglycine alpha-amidating lyase family protein [Prosthecomicrobium hirschii]KPL51691.1 peptidase [Prosthecomicrobium hirschii]